MLLSEWCVDVVMPLTMLDEMYGKDLRRPFRFSSIPASWVVLRLRTLWWLETFATVKSDPQAGRRQVTLRVLLDSLGRVRVLWLV